MGEPKWTKEPPTEPGWYWVHRAIFHGRVVVAEIVQVEGKKARRVGGSNRMDHARMRDWLWWSDPIVEPAPALGSPEREGNDA